MKKPLFIMLLFIGSILFSVPGVFAALSDNVVLYYTFDNDEVSGSTILDSGTLSNDGTIDGATTGVSGVIGESFSFDGTNDFVYLSDRASLDINPEITISMWAKSAGATWNANGCFVSKYDDGNTDVTYLIHPTSGTKNFLGIIGDGTSTLGLLSITYTGTITDWHHYVMTYNTTHIEFFIDDVSQGTQAFTTGIHTNGKRLTIGKSDFSPPRFCAATFDEVGIWNRSLSRSEITSLYNSGSGLQYPFSSSNTTANNTYTVNVTNLYNDTPLSGANVTWYTQEIGFRDVKHSSLTGTDGLASFITNESPSIWGNDLKFNVTYTDYYPNTNETRTQTANTTANAPLYQGHVNITSIKQLVTNNTLSAALGVWTINTSGGKTYAECTGTYPCLIYLRNGSNTLTLQYTGAGNYYDKDFIVTINAPSSTTAVVTGVYDSLYNVSAVNAYTGASIANFTINISNSTHSYTASYPTTAGYVLIPATKNIGFFTLIDAPGYVLANTTNNIGNYTPYHQFSLWSNNSVRVYIYDQDTGLNMSGVNVTIYVIDSLNSTITYSTNTSFIYITNLTDGTYTFTFSATNYTESDYVVTVADRSTQILNGYMLQASETVVFTTLDSLTSSALEGVTVGMYRRIGGVLTLISTKSTDITGRVLFYYKPNTEFAFTMAKTGYETKSFTLDPIIFSSYDVYLTRLVSESQSYSDISLYHTPNIFYNGQNNNLTVTINSPSGNLENYSFSLTYPGGTSNYSGSNAYGASNVFSFNITGATLLDTVLLNITYNTVYGENPTTTYLMAISGSYGNNTITTIKANAYGLGLFERIVLTVLLSIVVAGAATIFSGAGTGLIAGLAVMGFMVYALSIPVLVFLISAFIGFIIIARRTT